MGLPIYGSDAALAAVEACLLACCYHVSLLTNPDLHYEVDTTAMRYIGPVPWMTTSSLLEFKLELELFFKKKATDR
jgi:hypothetical protein